MHYALVRLGNCTKYILPSVQRPIQLADRWRHTFNQLKILSLSSGRNLTPLNLKDGRVTVRNKIGTGGRMSRVRSEYGDKTADGSRTSAYGKKGSMC